MKRKKMYVFLSTPSTFLDEYITAMKPAATFKGSISKWILCKYQIILGVLVIFTHRNFQILKAHSLIFGLYL